MKVKVFLSLIFSCCLVTISAQELKLYDLQIFDKSERERVVFSSFSDSYLLSENPDSSAVPGLEGNDTNSVNYLVLEGEYRKRFLNGTGISETDHLFMYNYAANKLISLNVKELKMVACISIYTNEGDFPLHDYNYQIGFEIDKNTLTGFSEEYCSTTLVAFGTENPFEKGKMMPIKWIQTDQDKLPETIRHSLGNALIAEGYKNYEKNEIYRCKSDGFQIFIQKLSIEVDNIQVEHLMVLDQNDEVVCDKLFFEGEGSVNAPLNGSFKEVGYEQWTGKLFKDKPPVVFGFAYYGFGCPEISFLKKDMEDIYINCDNRH